MTKDELKYELFRLKTISKNNRKEILWKLISFYILTVIISLGLFFVEYRPYIQRSDNIQYNYNDTVFDYIHSIQYIKLY